MENIKKYALENYEETLSVIRDLCKIPAPSGKEEKRAEYCLKWLNENGAEGAYIDDALNVIYPHNCDGSNEITVVVAHTDTVFPDTEPMPLYEDEDKMYSPGVGDDTASVAVLLMTARYFIRNNIKPQGGILFVCNSCEEGLGNLKGAKEIMKVYAGRVSQFVSFDKSYFGGIQNKCVGSCRYEVEVTTPGGHSFSKFGNKNAIAELSKIVTKIYEIDVPHIEDSITTYNVGSIEGGTSVNTIAQSAKMLCEYRSDNSECLEIMGKYFDEIFSNAKGDNVDVNVKVIGVRPCEKGVDPEKKKTLLDKLADAMVSVVGGEIEYCSMSTDCNIPLSMGIPAGCIGVYCGEGAHTREEWIEKNSIKTGLEVGITSLVKLF